MIVLLPSVELRGESVRTAYAVVRANNILNKIKGEQLDEAAVLDARGSAAPTRDRAGEEDDMWGLALEPRGIDEIVDQAVRTPSCSCWQVSLRLAQASKAFYKRTRS